MIEISKTEVVGFEPALRGMRNPKNSWQNADSRSITIPRDEKDESDLFYETFFYIGENDLKLAKTLANAGTDHGKFLRMINVYCDVNAPLYWWKEADTYRMGVEKNSCSTMHKIHSKEFTIDDFSTDHLIDLDSNPIWCIINKLNEDRLAYIETKNKDYWYEMIQLLPTSYNQKRTCMFNYASLRNMYHARKTHKLDEWHRFCEWIETLPYSELITGEEV